MSAHPALHPQSLELPPDTAPTPEGAVGTMGEELVQNMKAGAQAASDTPEQPVTPRPIIPCSPTFDLKETRIYAGVSARHLAWAAPELLRHKSEAGLGGLYQGLWNFTLKMRNALLIYTRVKRALRWLHKPQKVNYYIDDLPPLTDRPKGHAPHPTPRPRFTWAISPKETYQWETFVARFGFDVRETSLTWIERRVAVARQAARSKAIKAFKDREGLVTPPPKAATLTETRAAADIETRVFKPQTGQFGQIWPPVPVPDIADAPVTVTADYASTRRARYMAEHRVACETDPDEAVIGVMIFEDETTGDSLRDDVTWYVLTGEFDLTQNGLVYAPNPNLKPP